MDKDSLLARLTASAGGTPLRQARERRKSTVDLDKAVENLPRKETENVEPKSGNRPLLEVPKRENVEPKSGNRPLLEVPKREKNDKNDVPTFAPLRHPPPNIRCHPSPHVQ